MPEPMPNSVQMLLGMESMATLKMKQKIVNKGVANIVELRSDCIEAVVMMIACQMTADLFDFKKKILLMRLNLAARQRFSNLWASQI